MRLTCNIVRDLVGVCTDCAASDETKEAVQAHLAECPACARYYYDYGRIGQKYRAKRAHPADTGEMDYGALSERIRRRRNTEMAAGAAALVAAVGMSALVFSKFMKK